MNCIVETSDSKGRFLVAAKDFEVGDVVASQWPYAAVLFNDNVSHFCSRCFQPGSDLRRCARSKFARYCSKTCQLEDWKDGYRYECELLTECAPRIPPASIRLAARVVWKRMREMEILSSDENEWSGFKAVESLIDHWDELSSERMKTFAEMGFFITKICPHLPEEGLVLNEPLVKSLAKLLAKFAFNNHTVSSSSVTNLGVGVYPLMAMANHSSWPNCIQRFNGKLCEFRAIRPIKIGEEITITYVDLMATSIEMHEVLRKDYLFDLLPSIENRPPKKIPIRSNVDGVIWNSLPSWIVTAKDIELTKIVQKDETKGGGLVLVHEEVDASSSEWKIEHETAPSTKSKKLSFVVHLWGDWIQCTKQKDWRSIVQQFESIQRGFLKGQDLHQENRFAEAFQSTKSAMDLASKPLFGDYQLSETHILKLRIVDLLRKVVVDVGTDWYLGLDCYRRLEKSHDFLFPHFWSERGSQLAAMARLEVNYGDVKNGLRCAEEAVRILRVTDGSGEVLEEMKKLEANLRFEIDYQQKCLENQ